MNKVPFLHSVSLVQDKLILSKCFEFQASSDDCSICEAESILKGNNGKFLVSCYLEFVILKYYHRFCEPDIAVISAEIIDFIRLLLFIEVFFALVLQAI